MWLAARSCHRPPGGRSHPAAAAAVPGTGSPAGGGQGGEPWPMPWTTPARIGGRGGPGPEAVARGRDGLALAGAHGGGRRMVEGTGGLPGGFIPVRRREGDEPHEVGHEQLEVGGLSPAELVRPIPPRRR